MKKRDAALVVMIVLGATGTGPCVAHEAPRLVEYFQGVKHVQNTGEAASARSAVESSTLDAIHDDPSAVDVQVGMAFPDAVRDARALSLELPGSNDAGLEVSASFGNLEIEQRAEDDYSVYGRNESPASEISLVVMGKDVVGTITYESEVYEVRPLGGGLTAVYRVDTSEWPGTECGVTHQPLPESLHERSKESTTGSTEQDPSRDTAGSRAAQDTGEMIDVLVAYTERARVGAGNIDARIRQFFEDANRMYVNSRIRPRIRLVHSYRTEYTQDDDMRIDKTRLKAPDDGYMDEVHALRDQYGADLVALLVGQRSNYCGFADIYYGSEAGGFSVTSQTCSSTIFAHEIGHNQGAHHDPGTNTNEGFPYGHGFCNSQGNWRTVMSYNFNESCWPRVPHFSNPNVSYRGVPTGDASTRHNVRVINETAFHVANFRKALPPPHAIPLVMSADNMTQQGFLRVINRSNRAGRVRIDAFDDDGGDPFGPVYLFLDAKQTRHFNSMDLEDGNSEKGLSGGTRSGTGNWRLHLTTDLDIKPRAYIRTTDGFLTSIHEVADEEGEGSMRYRVPTFNPGKNTDQQSLLRLINAGDGTASIEITGLDDKGTPPSGGSVRLTLPAGAAHVLSAQELEQGADGITGQLGTGSGKWQLSVEADQPLQVMSLLFSRTGNLTNLSR